MPGRTRATWRPAVAALALAATAAGCAKIPPDRYGVGRIRVEGARQMSPTSLERCLATQDRDHLGVTLGLVTPGSCGEPPFDVEPPRLELWSWPWEDWPLLDRVALERDRARVERWYTARGFHDARVVELRVDPDGALEEDGLPADEEHPGCDRRRGGQGCIAEVTIVVEEGEPTRLEEVRVDGLDALPGGLRRELRDAVPLRAGDRFDEALFDRGEQRLVDRLGREGYALARVESVARVDRRARRAWVAYAVEPGPTCVFGEVHVEGDEYLPAEPIRRVTLIEPGQPYDFERLVDAQRAITDLGAFTAVTVEPVLPEEGNVVDVRVDVRPAREAELRLGGGIQAGELQTLTENVSVPQWDLHLLALYEHRNVFGGMRRFRLEERPRLIVQQPFPRFDRPRFGNIVSARFDQPAFLEPRTTLTVNAAHTFGPDPFDVFFRHRLDTEISARREFFGDALLLRGALGSSLYRVPDGEEKQNGDPPPANSYLSYFEVLARLDLRDDPQRPHGGAFFQTTTTVAGLLLPSSWTYVRLVPDARFYVPLPFRITLAMRFRLGMLFIRDASSSLDELSQELGPRDYRLRGGGASSNRGYLPGQLGDGREGGTRRWEASAELRVPVAESIGLVGFWDMGDVSREPRFRFDRPQAAAGFGLRFFTLVGAIRFDFAWRVKDLQVLSAEDDRIFDPPGPRQDFVFHLTIGEAF